MNNWGVLPGKAAGKFRNKDLFSFTHRYEENIPRNIIDSLEAAIYTCNAAGYITMYNEAAVALWGRRPEIGKDLWCGSWKIYEPDGKTPLSLDSCPMAIVLKGGVVENGTEIIIEKPGGERSHVIPYPRPLLDDQGKITGAVNFLLDITSLKKAEQLQGHLAAIVRYSDDAIISKTLDGIITSWNEAAEKMFGYTSAEMIGRSMLTIIPKDRWDEENYIQSQLRKGNKIDHYETKRITRDNRLLDVSLTISPVRDRAGNIIGASKIARDITQRKQNEKAILESEERLRLAVQTAKLGTWVMDPATGNIECSDDCRRILGFPAITNINLELLLELVHPLDTNIIQDTLLQVYRYGTAADYDIEHRIITPDDHTVKWIRIRCKMYFTAEGQPEKLIGTIMDITDEKETREYLEMKVRERTVELERVNRELQRSNCDLEQFAFVASHDLQEPLRKIRSFVTLIEERTESRETLEPYFNKISLAASRMSAIIKDVLDYSRLGRNEALFSEVSLDKVLNEVIIDNETLIAAKQARIRFVNLPPVWGINMQLRQLFNNLINNSLKFSSASPEITITHSWLTTAEISAIPSLDPERNYLKLVLTDNGIGFEPQYAERIFRIFERLHGHSEYAGTGIGLALCKKVAENHGGHISAESEPGKGSRFIVILPA